MGTGILATVTQVTFLLPIINPSFTSWADILTCFADDTLITPFHSKAALASNQGKYSPIRTQDTAERSIDKNRNNYHCQEYKEVPR